MHGTQAQSPPFITSPALSFLQCVLRMPVTWKVWLNPHWEQYLGHGGNSWRLIDGRASARIHPFQPSFCFLL